jgi:hypothetical protein
MKVLGLQSSVFGLNCSVFRLCADVLTLTIAISGHSLAFGQTAKVRPGPTYFGMCDASAAAALGDGGFIMANDEDNVLRVFSRHEGGLARTVFDWNAHLRPEPDEPETDIEGASWLNEQIYWITSHGRNRDGKLRLSRYRIFATEFVRRDGRLSLVPVGSPYSQLVFDLIRDPQLRKFDLADASTKAPKSKDGLNIEGLTFTPAGSLWIGFRNPLRKGKALIVPLLNPQHIMHFERARFGIPIEIDLDDHGIRSIEYVRQLKEYLILAGPPSKGSVRLYRWSGANSDKPRRIKNIDFGSLTPEAFVIYPNSAGFEVQFFSDDGTREVAGTVCKTLVNAEQRRFRSVTWNGLN